MATPWLRLLVLLALAACSSGNPLNGGTRKGCNLTAVEGDSATVVFDLVTGNNVTFLSLTSQQDPDRTLVDCDLTQPDAVKKCNELSATRGSKFSIESVAAGHGLLRVQFGLRNIERSMEGAYSLHGFATVALPAVVCALRVTEAPTTLRTVGLTTTSAHIVPAEPESKSNSTGIAVGVVCGLLLLALLAGLAVLILRKSSRDWLMSVLRVSPCCARASRSHEETNQPEEVPVSGGDGQRQEEAEPFLETVNEVDGASIELQVVHTKPLQATEPLCETKGTNGQALSLPKAKDAPKMEESIAAVAAKDAGAQSLATEGNASAANLSTNDSVKAEPSPAIGTADASADRRFDWPVETLTREDTEHKLLSPGQTNGAFLIRHTSHKNTLALAVRRPGRHVSFHRIDITDNGFEMVLSMKTRRFQTLAELVKVVTTPDGLFDYREYKG